MPIALVSFNLGVELGQLAVLSIALPLVLAARNAPWFGDRGVKTLSIAIAIGGGVLFVVRLVALSVAAFWSRISRILPRGGDTR